MSPKKLNREEINRKLLHLLALLMPASIFYIPYIFKTTASIPAIGLGLILACSIIVEYLRRQKSGVNEIIMRWLGSMMRPGEKTGITGSTYIIAAAWACALIFHKRPDVAFISLSIFIMGDAVAALVGLSVGKIPVLGKSLEGSMACFFTAFAMMVFVFPFCPGVLNAWGGSIPISLAAGTALCVTLLELIPLRLPFIGTINDNLAAPVLTGFGLLGIDVWLAAGPVVP